MSPYSKPLRALALAATLALPACVGASLHASAPSAPTDGLSKCSIAKGQDNPLVTEWPASEKANLEALLRRGAVVVSYSGCELRMMPSCPARGLYAWRRTTTATDVIEIHNADELFAKLPLGALTLEGELQRSGRLAVQTTVGGQLVLQGFEAGDVAANPACVGATHVIGQMSVGAFKLRSGGAIVARGGVSVPLAGGGVVSSSDEVIVREAGDPGTCKASTDQAPSPECGSPLQVFLQPLPQTLVDRGPPGTVKVNFVSAETDRTWDVVVGDRKLCTTPCERWLDPLMPYAMRSIAGFLQKDHVAEVPDLRAHQGQGALQVRAHPRSLAGLAGGLTATSLGGMGLVTGIVLLAVGCSSDSQPSMCTAGKITLPAGAIVTGGGIYLVVTSAERVELFPAARMSRVGLGGSF